MPGASAGAAHQRQIKAFGQDMALSQRAHFRPPGDLGDFQSDVQGKDLLAAPGI